MYKIEINIAEWDLGDDSVVVETDDFSKIEIIAEFIEFMQLHNWAVDYDVVEDYEYQCDEEEEVSEDEVDEDESAEDEESEEYEIGDTVEDEDGLVWERVA
jgi:hypothetical protein